MRCAGCGKPIGPGEDTVDIQTGIYDGQILEESERWGLMHKRCFNRSIDSPEAALEELKRLSEEK